MSTLSQSKVSARTFLTSAALLAALVCTSGVTLVATAGSSPAWAQESPPDITGTQEKAEIDRRLHKIDPKHYPAPPKEDPKPEGPSWAESCWNGVCTLVKAVVYPGGIIVDYIRDHVVDPPVDEAAEQKRHNDDVRKQAEAEANQKNAERKPAEAPKTEIQKTEIQKTEMQKPELKKVEAKTQVSTTKIEAIVPKKLGLVTANTVQSAAAPKPALKVETGRVEVVKAPAAIVNVNAMTAPKQLTLPAMAHPMMAQTLNTAALNSRFTAMTMTKR
jgi:hypothetical protein